MNIKSTVKSLLVAMFLTISTLSTPLTIVNLSKHSIDLTLNDNDELITPHSISQIQLEETNYRLAQNHSSYWLFPEVFPEPQGPLLHINIRGWGIYNDTTQKWSHYYGNLSAGNVDEIITDNDYLIFAGGDYPHYGITELHAQLIRKKDIQSIVRDYYHYREHIRALLAKDANQPYLNRAENKDLKNILVKLNN